MIRKLFLILFLCLSSMAYSQQVDEKWVKDHYAKKEVMIPMRDGVKLFTAIYSPLSNNEKHPILLFRTPYSAYPYGEGYCDQLWYVLQEYVKSDYIIVYQDVRGKCKSEGSFMNVRPYKAKKNDIDEPSDSYDTIDWLIKKTKSNNGKVGVSGCSYLGFYAMMAAYSNHPALKAVCPQAPVTDWYMGDDTHQNGALMLESAYSFLTGFDYRPEDEELKRNPINFSHAQDSYSFFLEKGALKNIVDYIHGVSPFWKGMAKHPDYDEWWKERNTMLNCKNVKPAVLVVGGLFDAEDMYGSLNAYKSILKKSPSTHLRFIMGPWAHGAWIWGYINSLGNIRFGNFNTTDLHKDKEKQFFDYYLLGKGSDIGNVNVFFTGENKWHSYSSWPCQNISEKKLYLHQNGSLDGNMPQQEMSFSEYISDPSKPVPYTSEITNYRGIEFLTEDQRFASTRNDVLCYKSKPLEKDCTVGGEVGVNLDVAISTTDADFIVKVIDCFPDDFKYNDDVDGKGSGKPYYMGGYQMLVRGEVMRGRYRDSFTHPQPFVPGKITHIAYKLNDIAHTFKKGHRIMIQIQSTWFPFIDRNPQQFVNIFNCSDEDYIPSQIKIYHQKNACSSVTFNEIQ